MKPLALIQDFNPGGLGINETLAKLLRKATPNFNHVKLESERPGFQVDSHSDQCREEFSLARTRR